MSLYIVVIEQGVFHLEISTRGELRLDLLCIDIVRLVEDCNRDVLHLAAECLTKKDNLRNRDTKEYQ